VNEAAHLLDLFFLDEVERVEVFDFGGDGAGKVGGVEMRNRATPLLPAIRFSRSQARL